MTSPVKRLSQINPLFVCTELVVVGLITTMLQILAVMSLRSLDNIFTSSSQLFLLLPIAGCILLVVVASAFAESKARDYVVQLDTRLLTLYDLMQPIKLAYAKNFLPNIFFPILYYLPSTPFVGLFLILTTPYLFAVFALCLGLQFWIIIRFNRAIRKSSLLIVSPVPSLSRKSEAGFLEIPDFLLRDQAFSAHTNITDDENSSYGDDSRPQEKLLRKKRDALRIVRAFSQASVLATSAVLALLQISSLGDILGFFIISSSFRRGLTAVVEFYFPRFTSITLNLAFEYFSDSVLCSERVYSLIEARYKESDQLRAAFNDRFEQYIHGKPIIRFRQFSLLHDADGLILDRITQRLVLKPFMLVHIPSYKLYKQLRRLIIDLTTKQISRWKTSGSVLLSGQAFPQFLLTTLPIRSPWLVRPTTSNLADNFNPALRVRCLSIIQDYHLDSLLTESGPFLPIVSDMSRRQILRLRSLVACLTTVLEPSRLSILAYALDCFEESERSLLIRLISEQGDASSICTICLSRKISERQQYAEHYQLSRSSLDPES